MRSFAAFLLGLMLLPGVAVAAVQPGALPATGSNGRLMFLIRGHAAVSETRSGDELILVPALAPIQPGGVPVPGVVSVQSDSNQTRIQLQHDAVVRTSQGRGRFILDVKAPLPEKSLEHPVAPAKDPVLPGLPAPMMAVVDAPRSPVEHETAQQSATATAIVEAPAGGPVSIAATLVPSVPDRPAELLLPFDSTVGAAAFRRAGRLEIVFDSRKPIDLSASGADPAFQKARLILLAAGTLLDMPFDAEHPVGLTRVGEGWLLSRKAVQTQPVLPVAVADGLVFAMAEPGSVMTVPDPAGGGDLLVGTTRSDTRNVTASMHTPGYQLVPSVLGVVAERISDRTELRPLAGGFRLIDPYPSGVSDRPSVGESFSRSVELTPVSRAEQWRRYKAALATSASLAPGSRRGPRLDAARAALALGFGAETRRLAGIADQDSPGAPDRAVSAFLIGAGALLAGDDDAGRLLDDPSVGNSDEAVLWRNLAAARQEPADRTAAQPIATLWPLLQSYPAPVREQLVGDAALFLARNGDPEARKLVAKLAMDTGKAGLARAVVSEGPDKDAQALARLDRLRGDADPAVTLAAALEAIDLRLRDGMISPAEAGRRTARLIYDGRMAGRELQVALRAAQLLSQARDWSGALSILREQARTPGDGMPAIRQAVEAILSQVADAVPAGGKDGAPMTGPADALGAVALVEQNQDLLPPDADKVGLSTRLADRLASHELPDRAVTFLRGAFQQSPPGADKAALGMALAETLMQQDDAKGARATLDALDPATLPTALSRRRTLLDARLLAAGGDRQAAIAELARLDDPDALSVRATMMGEAKDWAGQASALAQMLAARLPKGPAGAPLGQEDADLVVRLAGALSRSGQAEAVRQLQRTWSPAITDPSKRDMVALLAAPDVTSVGDLPRSAGDLAAARNAMKVLGGGAG